MLGSDVFLKDTDNDGLNDGFEVTYQLENESAYDDADGDGFSNLEEFSAGSDPRDVAAMPTTTEGGLLWHSTSNIAADEMAVDQDGTVYSRAGDLLKAVNETGQTIWQRSYVGVSQGPLLMRNGQLLMVTRTGLYMLDAQTGVEQWFYAGNYFKATVSGEGAIYSITYDGELDKISIDGSLLWSHLPSPKFNNAIAPVINNDGVVYLTTNYGGNYVMAMSASGNELWRASTGSYSSNSASHLALDDQGNVVFSTSKNIHKYDVNGQRMWLRHPPTAPNLKMVSTIDSEGNIYTALGGSAVLKMDSAGNTLWQANVSYINSNGTGLTLDSDGNLWVPKSNEGLIKITQDGDVEIVAATTLSHPKEIRVSEERLYVSTSNGLYSLFSGTNENTLAWSGAGGGNSNAHNSCALDDADCDGLPDSYEMAHGLDMNLYNRYGDQDRDGLGDYAEYLAGTNVNDSDSDNDKLLDGYEVQFGMDPLLDDAASSDIDEDGYSDLLEFEAGTDPTDPLALPSQDLGAFKWSVEPSATTAPVIDSHGVLYFGTDYGLVGYSNKGSKIWSLNLYGAVISTPVLGQQNDIYVIRGSSLYSVNSITGGIKWSSEFSNNALLSAIGGNGDIYLLEGNNVHALDSVTGDITWTYTHTRALQPALTAGKNGDVYISDSNYFYALSSKGSLRWTNMTAGYLNKSPLVTNDGNIIAVSTFKRRLYSLSEAGDLLWDTSLYYPNDHELVLTDTGNVLIYNRGDLRSYSSVSGDNLNHVSGWYTSLPTGPIVASNGLAYSIEHNYLRTYDNAGALVEQVNAIAAKSGGYSIKMDSDGTLYYLTKNGLRAIYSNASGLSDLSAWPTQGKDNLNRSNAACTKDDSDCDGMPDNYEFLFGLNPLSGKDTSADLDDDGFNNLVEFKNGTDPINPFSNNDCFIGDSDCDGVPDEWEDRYGLDIYNPNDALQDLDLDGFTNKKEFLDGTDPTDRLSNSSCYSNDSDCDGMFDHWEVKFGLNPFDPSDAIEDSDNDGFDNLEEHNNGTDPLVSK